MTITGSSLNPSYSGSWLWGFYEISGLERLRIVLTLLILEVGFGEELSDEQRDQYDVLTLLILEVGFGATIEDRVKFTSQVLTLLILEVGFGVLQLCPNRRIGPGLNPSYSGSWLWGLIFLLQTGFLKSLNPSYSGSWLWGGGFIDWEEREVS